MDKQQPNDNPGTPTQPDQSTQDGQSLQTPQALQHSQRSQTPLSNNPDQEGEQPQPLQISQEFQSSATNNLRSGDTKSTEQLPNTTNIGNTENNQQSPPTAHINKSESSSKHNLFFNFWLKMLFMLGFTVIFLFTGITIIKKVFNQNISDHDVLLETNYKISSWQNYGQVFEPIIEIPIYYSQKGYQNEEFLLDSGALVSSLPREKAEPLGFSLSMLPRSTFKGFGNSTTFAYRADLKVLLGNKEISIPVVFTETAGTKSILGRSGFFENYSVYFDSKAQKIQIRN